MQAVEVAVPRPLFSVYTYAWELESAPVIGDIVQVSFGRKELTGVVTKVLPEAPDGRPLKSVLRRIDSYFRVPEETLSLALWSAEYFRAPPGEAVAAAIAPKLSLWKGKRKKLPTAVLKDPNLNPLNAEQQAVLQKITHDWSLPAVRPVLLHGVTGSGKTEVYLHLARAALDRGESVLVLVPEIALTPQLRHRFEDSLGIQVDLWHSAVADGQRQNQWLWANEGTTRVIVGARSAVFAPLKNLGLIVVDEEHDSSYKQAERFRYQARDLAFVRASKAGCKLILGSATPSMETWVKAQDGRVLLASLKQRHEGAELPVVEIVTLKKDDGIARGEVILAKQVVRDVTEALDRGEQAIFYLNRRGFAHYVTCMPCGWVKECVACSVSMTVYRRRGALQCHQCGREERIPEVCAKCGSSELGTVGCGTEALEDQLPKIFPQARIVRLDRDVMTSHKRLEEALERFRSGDANILVGTQMVVKGHDFPKVTRVVVTHADSLFRWPDFRAEERAVQTILQVSGRAGRGELRGKVLIQTLCPDHPVLKVAVGLRTWESWANDELELRQEARYPPFLRMLRVRVEDLTLEAATIHLEQLRNRLHQELPDLELLGPSPSLIDKVENKYRVDLYLKTASVADLMKSSHWLAAAAESLKLDFSLDVDPHSVV
jgi:primosomal protein N' (replication factor Y) (superfamily II helicase)